MSIQANVNVKFQLGPDSYGVDLKLPSSTPTAAAPFLFNVDSLKPDGTVLDNLLAVAVGSTAEIYVEVAPPKSLLTEVAGDVVQQLNVVVSEGTYDPVTQTFLTKP